MKESIVFLAFLVLTFNIFAAENESNNNILNNFGFNLGVGTSVISDANFNPDFCFHAGIDYTLDENNFSQVGLRYHKLNYNFEVTISVLDYVQVIKGDLDLDAFYLYYRLPLGNFTLSIGPGILSKYDVSYFMPGLDIGYLNSIGEKWGYDIAATTFYLDKSEDLYFYFHAGLWIKI